MSVGKNYSLLPVFTLVLLSFILGTSEFIVVGILPEIASDIDCSIAMAGNLISFFAFAYAVGTPFVTAFLSPFNRYYTLLGLTAAFILSNVLCAIAPNYFVLIAARIITAIISGTVLSVSMTFSTEIAPPQDQPKVISWIFSGFSVSSIFGVPIGTLICQVFDWRITFAVLSVFSLIILLMLRHYLPNVGKGARNNLMSQFALFKSVRIQFGMMMVICGAAGSYVFYTFMTPFITEVLQVPSLEISLILSIFGVATIISNLASGRIAGLGGVKKMPIVYLVQALCLAAIFITAHSTLLGLANIMLIGVIMYLQNSPAQLHFLRTAKLEKPDALSLASALNPVSFNTGIAIGSSVGSLIITFADMPYIGIGGSVFALGAMFANMYLLRNMTDIRKRASSRAVMNLHKNMV